MAKIIMENEKKEVPDNSPIMPPCEELGVAFGCNSGICGTCRIEVLEGMENLSEMTQAEKDMGLEGNERLACQCRILKGTVKIKYF